jgi:hypothetical protein
MGRCSLWPQSKSPDFIAKIKAFSNALDGGAKEARTPDLLNAIQTLYQLSYDPIHKTVCNFNFFALQVNPFPPVKWIEPARQNS